LRPVSRQCFAICNLSTLHRRAAYQQDSRRRRLPSLSSLACIFLSVCLFLADGTALAQTAEQRAESIRRSLSFLNEMMDEFHSRIPVYDDVSSAGNRFVAFGAIPDGTAPVSVNGSWTTLPRSGATAMRFTFMPRSSVDFGGMYMLMGVLPAGAAAPTPQFGTQPNAGADLTGAARLTFWARGAVGGERIEFFMGGVGRDPLSGTPLQPYPDSTVRRPTTGTIFTLSANWQQFTVDLSGANLSYIVGGFGWVANAPNTLTGVEFFVDDVQYELTAQAQTLRLNQPRLIRSYRTHPVQPDPFDVNLVDDIDITLRNTAFVYDNALAILAFLAEGSSDSVRRAKLIGDALVYASQHDRYFDDGRLRSAYFAGDLVLPPGWTPNGRVGTVAIPGFFNEAQQRFFEVEQGAVDSGNNAWAVVSLVALYRQTQQSTYLDAAKKIGAWLLTQRQSSGAYQGFLGGIAAPESSNPQQRVYASVEHNLDLYAAFTELARLTGEPVWRTAADHASTFLDAMYDTQRGCLLAGTLDATTRNSIATQLPLDVQAWALLALPDALARFPALLQCMETHHRTSESGFDGVDFNDDKDGVWLEGTAQAATALQSIGRPDQAASWVATLRNVQSNTSFGDGAGHVAALHDGLSTGFSFTYSRRLHVGATAWNVFAQTQRNPYYLLATPTAPMPSSPSRGSGCFIATAAYESYLHPDVQVLRRFRDNVLQKSAWGHSFVDWYYRKSPTFAHYIAERPLARGVVRMMLTPIVYLLEYPVVAPIILGGIAMGLVHRAHRRGSGLAEPHQDARDSTAA
jgi:hypothetical protein